MASDQELARLLAAFEARQRKGDRAARLERASVIASDDGTRSVGVRQALIGSRAVPYEGALALRDYLPVTLDGMTSLYVTPVQPDPVAGLLWLSPETIVSTVVGGVWVVAEDQSGAPALAGLREALVTDDGRIDVWQQVAEPVGASFGDLWFKVDNDRAPYRWEGSSWVPLFTVTSQSTTFVPGEEGWGFQPDGDAQVKDLNVLGSLAGRSGSFDSLSLNGNDLATQLAGTSVGKIISARLAAQASNLAVSATNTKVFELNCGTVAGGRTYRIVCSLFLSTSGTQAFTDRTIISFRYTTDGTSPTTSSPEMDNGFDDNSVGPGSALGVVASAEVDIPDTCPLTVGLFIYNQSGTMTRSIYATSGSPRSRPVMSLYDDGPMGQRQDSAISLTGGGTTRFVKTFNPIWANGTQGATWNELANSAYCDVGNSASYGNGMFGAVGFNSSDIISKLAGLVTPISLVLRWRCRTRSTSGGLDVRILSHNYATLSAFTNAWFPQQWDNPPRDITSVTTHANAAPGVTVDTSLGTALLSQLRSGTRKGICIANSGSPSYNSQPDGTGTFYSYGSYQPQLIATYDGTS